MRYLLVFLCSLGCLTASAAPVKPNIVLILADDVGCEPTGAYGGERWKTPNIDALARGGMRFDHCYSMPVCHPSRLALLTGKYPFRLKSGWGSFPKAEEKNTIAQVLRRAGYATAVAGKWQLVLMKTDKQHPNRLGFDEWSVFGWHEGARYHDPMIYQNGKVRDELKGRYGPDMYVDFLGEFMEKNSKTGKPFFAFYSMALAHDVTDDLKWQVPYAPGKDRWMNYGEMVESMDAMVGRLVTKLDALKLRENTLILFSGDNGTAAKSKLRHRKGVGYEKEQVYSIQNGQRIPGGKGSLLDIGTHVPLIANWQNTVAAGSQSQALVDFSDWLPTFAHLAKAQLPSSQLDGRSFVPALLGQAQKKARAFAFAESKGGKGWARTRQYKLYNNGKFFDMKNDPMEKKPLAKPTGHAASGLELLHGSMKRLGFPFKR
jgi:arylsulfatase A